MPTQRPRIQAAVAINLLPRQSEPGIAVYCGQRSAGPHRFESCRTGVEIMDQAIKEGHSNGSATTDDGVDRRGFLKCMAWAGTGLLWSTACGVPSSRALG